MRITPDVIHSALEYIISRAILEGKIGESVISIPLTNFETPHESFKFTDDAQDLALKLTIQTDWISAEEAEELIETNLDEEEQEDGEEELFDAEDAEDTRGESSRSSNKNKKSH